MNLTQIAIRIAQGPRPPSSGSTGGSASNRITPPSGVHLEGAGGGATIEGTIVTVINWGLGVAGGVAVLVLIVSAYYYVTAAGDEKRIERGKEGIKAAITGIIIMLLAAVIVNTINAALF